MRRGVMLQHQWLGATSLHSRDPASAAVVGTIALLCDAYPQLRVIINLFDSEPVDAPAWVARHSRGSSQTEGTNVAGMKTLFWKLKLTPAVTRGLRAVWLFDCERAHTDSIHRPLLVARLQTESSVNIPRDCERQ